LQRVYTTEGMPLPPNVSAKLQRDMARLRFAVSQIREIEEARQKRLEQQPETGSHAMVQLLARVDRAAGTPLSTGAAPYDLWCSLAS